GGRGAAAAGVEAPRRGAIWPRAPAAPPPYFALGPLRPRLMLTHGGLRVDAAMQVLGADGAPLPALYAAGNAAAAVVSAGGHGYGIGWAIISGRRAGQSAARAARTGGAL